MTGIVKGPAQRRNQERESAPPPRNPGGRASARPPAAAAALLAAVVSAACASPWTLSEASTVEPGVPPSLPPHLAVAEATLERRGDSFGALAYLGIRAGDLRMHLGAESGLTILDLTVRGAEVRVEAESPLAGPPGLGAVLGADLRRLYGDRSVFALGPALPPARAVSGDPSGRVAFPLADGSWIALDPAALRDGGAPDRATLLRPDRSAEAEVEYLDPDADRIPREVRLRDLEDGHRVVLEIVEVRPRPAVARGRTP